MSLAKIGSGDGYTYYLRNVVTNDADVRGKQRLESYYSERGESPGRWIGSGLAALGITEGDQVSEAQMRSLIGFGQHPNAAQIKAQVRSEQRGLGATALEASRHAEKQVRLGRPFPTFTPDEHGFRAQCREAFAAWNIEQGQAADDPVPDEDRKRIRTSVARRMFHEEMGRDPIDARELSGWTARASRPPRRAVAGYDFTFSPPKSVSALWALAPREISEQIAAAHHAAVRDTLAYIEKTMAYTRTGRHSVRQVDTEGLIAMTFDHRDSRAGDPDIHTHLIVSNKVRRLDGGWGALDGRMVHQHTVAASELYNTRLLHHLEAGLGLAYARRRGLDPNKRPIFEIVGVSEDLMQVWSSRSAAINAELAVLAGRFQADHGREPTPRELLDLGEEATLSTRRGKHAPRSLAEQRTAWRHDAAQILGGEDAVHAMVASALNQPAPQRQPITEQWITVTAGQIVDIVAEQRASWQQQHIRAEAERQLRDSGIDPAQWQTTVERLVSTALAPPYSIPRGVPQDVGTAIDGFTRRDGTSVYVRAGSEMYTSEPIVAAEKRLVEIALQSGGRTIPARAVQLAGIEFAANHGGKALNPGQLQLVHEFATSGKQLQVAIAPAGTGKTTAMQVLSGAWTDAGGSVIGLAPTGAAAAVLGEEIGVQTGTVAMLVTVADRLADGSLDLEDAPDWVRSVGDSTLVILDEAAKCGTLQLDHAVQWLIDHGATIRAIGDDRQLSSVAAGGAIRDIVDQAGALTLTQVMRFADPRERAASLALREGDPAAIAFYTDHGRIQVGQLGAVTEAAFGAWAADTDAGLDSIMLAPTRDLVTVLNDRARTARLANLGGKSGPEVQLSDGLSASAGDIITTRRNHYRLRISTTDHVRNGYRWQVRAIHPDGRITASHLGSKRLITLPADYVRSWTTLGYASTIDTAQGMTVDTGHTVLAGREHRAQLYVAMTRGRAGNHAYVATAGGGEDDNAHTLEVIHPRTAVDVLTDILGRDGTQQSAASTKREAKDPFRQFAGAVDRYIDALGAFAEHKLGAEGLARIDTAAESLVPGLTDEPAWPVLRAHLATIALDQRDPVTELAAAVQQRELDTADDRAAVLDWRIDPSGAHSRAPGAQGPLSWVPPLPVHRYFDDPTYRAQVEPRYRVYAYYREEIKEAAKNWTAVSAPRWARPLVGENSALVADLAIWRAAHAVPEHDRRPTGPARYPVAERRVQQALDKRIVKHFRTPGTDTQRWRSFARALDPRILTDPYWPVLAAELEHANLTGHNIRTAVYDAATARPLPDEQPAAALRWRLADVFDEQRTEDPAAAARTTVREHPWRHFTDTQLERQIRVLQTTVDGLRRRKNSLIPRDPDTGEAISAPTNLERVTAEHTELDTTAAAIRKAQAKQKVADKLEQPVRTKQFDLTRAQSALNHTDGWHLIQRARLTRTIETLTNELAELNKPYQSARKAAQDAAEAVGQPEYTWSATLWHADDTGGSRTDELRQARAADAHTAQQLGQIEEHLTRDQQQLTAASAERERRDNLPGRAAEMEQRARAELFPPAPETPATRTTSTRSWDGPSYAPDPGPSAGHDHGYGL